MTVNFTNMTSPLELLAGANENTGGFFWATMWYTGIAIMIMSLLPFGIEAALLVSLFFGMITGMLLVYMGLLSGINLGIIIASLIVFAIYFMYSSNKNQ